VFQEGGQIMSRKNISTETKVQAVLSLLRKEESARAISRRYEVAEQTLYNWRDRFLEEGKRGLKGKTVDRSDIKRLEKEIQERDELIANLSVANYVLKKTAGKS
jgi:transposase-like protein